MSTVIEYTDIQASSSGLHALFSTLDQSTTRPLIAREIIHVPQLRPWSKFLQFHSSDRSSVNLFTPMRCLLVLRRQFRNHHPRKSKGLTTLEAHDPTLPPPYPIHGIVSTSTGSLVATTLTAALPPFSGKLHSTSRIVRSFRRNDVTSPAAADASCEG